MSPTVRVISFQPFKTRRGVDEVYGLAFRFDLDLVAALKATLRDATRALGYPMTVNGCLRTSAGGWLEKWQVWFCEVEAWAKVYALLRRLGYEVICEPPVTEATALDWPEDTGGLLVPAELRRN